MTCSPPETRRWFPRRTAFARISGPSSSAAARANASTIPFAVEYAERFGMAATDEKLMTLPLVHLSGEDRCRREIPLIGTSKMSAYCSSVTSMTSPRVSGLGELTSASTSPNVSSAVSHRCFTDLGR